jgi:hypothetical protein
MRFDFDGTGDYIRSCGPHKLKHPALCYRIGGRDSRGAVIEVDNGLAQGDQVGRHHFI